MSSLLGTRRSLLAPFSKAGGGGQVPSLLTNLVSYWKMNEAAGATRNDSTANLNNFADHNVVGQTAGVITNAALFVAASSQYLSAPNSASLQSGGKSIHGSLWVKPTTASVAQSLLSRGTSTGATSEWSLYAASGVVNFQIKDTASATIVAFGPTVANGVWQFIDFYIDIVAGRIGVQVNLGGYATAALTSGGTVSQNQPLVAGTFSDAATEFYNGAMCEVGYWTALAAPDPLSTSQVGRLYNNGLGRTYPL
jgi:hypothetical protein